MFYLINLNSVRKEMISEIQSDISSGRLFISERLNRKGQQLYPSLLLNAAKSLDVDGFIQTLDMQYFNSTYPRKTASGEITNPKMPYNANITL